ncbi:MAG: helix-turn-helix domain-containing protein [Actinomycetota bacterium]
MATIIGSSPGALGPALREVRVAEAITQSALAHLANVGRQWLNSFEMGDKPSAPIDMVMRVASALDVTLTLTPPSPPRSSDLDDEPIDLDALLSEFDR